MLTEIIKINPSTISFDSKNQNVIFNNSKEGLQAKDSLTKAANLIAKTSNTVAFPTETVYGLGGNALKDSSILEIYSAKERPPDNPLIIHFSSINHLRTFLKNSFVKKNISDDINNNNNNTNIALKILDEVYSPLINIFWPGPLTILLPNPQDYGISNLATASQSTFGVRVPSHPVARALISLANVPIAAPSANSSTRPSPTLASHVYSDLNGRIQIIIDGGSSNVGLESTVIDGIPLYNDKTNGIPLILRPGGISLEKISQLYLNIDRLKDINQYNIALLWKRLSMIKKTTAGINEQVRTPGMKYKHYSPKAPVVCFLPGCTSDVLYTYLVKFYQSLNYKDNKQLNVAYLPSLELPNDLTISTFNTNYFNIFDIPLGKETPTVARNLFAALRKSDQLNADIILVEGVPEENDGLAIMNRLKKAASVVVSATGEIMSKK